MSERSHEFERFVRRAHRRWVAWRAIERVGLSTLAACALSLPLIVVCWFQGESALGAVACALAIGASIGALWGILHPPTLLDTAIESDRQFNLHDLLGTALTLSRCACADDAARSMVYTLADEHSRRLAASRLILNRLGARAWGGIGLATALVLTLAMMTTSPSPTAARAGAVGPGARPDGASTQHPLATSGQTSRFVDRRAVSSPSSESHPHVEDPAGAGDREQAPAPHASNATASGDGAGNARGNTDGRVQNESPPVSPDRDAASGTTPAGAAGAPAARGDGGDDPTVSGQTRVTGSNVAPWQSHTWSAHRARALREVERGAVPDAYRDMVRAYFDDDR